MVRKRKTDLRKRGAPAKSGNARVFSYHANRSGADVQRGRYEPSPTRVSYASRRWAMFRHAPSAVAVVVIIISLAYASLLNSNPKVSVVASVAGQSLERPTNVYQEFIAAELSRGIMNKSKLTFDSRPIVRALQQKFPEVANAVVSLPLIGHRPIVKIAVTSPSFVLSGINGAYYINENGVPLAKLSEAKSELSGIATVVDESGLPIELGVQVLPRETVGFINDMLAQLTATNTPVDSVTLPVEANEIQVRIDNMPYAVRFNTRGDAREQVGTYRAVSATLKRTNTVPKQYIDVRVEERAYYK